MNIAHLSPILAPVASVVVVVVIFVLPLRVRMARRARRLLAQHPDAEQTSVYLAFRSGWQGGKKQEMDAKIAEMALAGWTYLRAAEASPLRTIRSWGGGLTLHFIRTDESQASHIAEQDHSSEPGLGVPLPFVTVSGPGH